MSDNKIYIGSEKINFKSVSLRLKPSSRDLPFLSKRSFRIITIGVCQKKIKIDSFLFLKFFSFFVGEKLCYLTAWFLRSPRVSIWFSNHLIRIYRGKKWKGTRLSSLHKGQPLGVFARTKILAVFQQAKTKKKKSKSNQTKILISASQSKLDRAKKFKTNSGNPNQGLKNLNKAFIGSRWLKNTDKIEILV